MHKYLFPSAIIGASVLGLSSTALAEQQTGLTANVGVTTNYVFRGITQTDDGPAIQGGIDYNHSSGFYAGAWGSNVKLPTQNSGLKSSLEADLYAGINFDVTQDVKMDVGYITYKYTDGKVDDNNGNSEVFVGAKYQNFSGYFYYGNPKASSGNSQYYDLRYTLDFVQDFKGTLHYGHWSGADNGYDADDIGVRVSKNFSGFDASLSFTRVDPSPGDAKNELFLSVTKSFDI